MYIDMFKGINTCKRYDRVELLFEYCLSCHVTLPSHFSEGRAGVEDDFAVLFISDQFSGLSVFIGILLILLFWARQQNQTNHLRAGRYYSVCVQSTSGEFREFH